MKLFSGSIFCFLLFTNFCNAGDQKPPLWGFPLIKKIKTSISGKANPSQATLPKKDSEEWTTVDMQEAVAGDRKKTPSPDIIIVQQVGKEESNTPKSENFQTFLQSASQLSADLKTDISAPQLPADLKIDIMIAAALGNHKKPIHTASQQNIPESEKPSFLALESYQNPIASAAIVTMNIDRDQVSSSSVDTKNTASSVLTMFINGCCPCIPSITLSDEQSKKKSNQTSSTQPSSQRLDTQKVINAIHREKYEEALHHIDTSSVDGDERL